MRALIAPALLCSLSLAACNGSPPEPMSAQSQAGLDTALAGLTPSGTTSCLPPTGSPVSSKVYGRVLLYTLAGGDVYRSDTGGGCEGGGDDILVQVSPEGRSCSGDIIRTVDRTSQITTGSCALGTFTRYTKPPKQ